MTDLTRLRELANTATPGTWTVEFEHREIWSDMTLVAEFDEVSDDDMQFMTWADPTTVLDLLDRIEAVDALHQPSRVPDWAGCDHYHYPCPTHLALHPECATICTHTEDQS